MFTILVICSYALLAVMSHGLIGRWVIEMFDHLVRDSLEWQRLVAAVNGAAPISLQRGTGLLLAAWWPVGLPFLYWTILGIRRMEDLGS